MFKLYGNVAGGWKKLDIATTEKDIIENMIDYANIYNLYDYLIINRQNNTDDIFLRIRTKEEFSNYLVEYRNKIKPLEDMSCVELKKYILNKKGSR